MRDKKNRHLLLIVAPLVISLFGLSGCMSKTAEIWGDPDAGLILKYRFAEGEALVYESTSEFLQSVEVMGQIQDVEGESSTTVSYESKGKTEDGLQLKVTLDAMDSYYASSMGEISADASEAVGKSFEMVLSPSGKELDFTGIEELKIDMGAEGNRDMSSDFQDSFPDLPENPVKIGDSWTSTVPIIQKSSTGETTLNFVSTYTLEGYETADGYECAKIRVEIQGTYNGTAQQQGIEMISEGTITGSGIFYFAYKEGLMVEMTSDGTMDAVVIIPSEGFELPMSRKFKGQVKLIK